MLRCIEERDLKECLKLLEELTIVGEVPNYLEIFNELKNNKNHYIFVYEEDNKILGMATLLIEQKFIHSGSRVGHIEDVVVSKNHRKSGIGKKLVDKCVEVAKYRQCYKTILDCDDNLLVFYTKMGFRRAGNYMKIIF